MKALVVFAALLVSPVSFAAPIAGGPTVTTLSCASVNRMVGVGYSLQVTTQAVAPQYSIRAISLVTRVVAPNAQPKVFPLNALKQDLNYASFAAGNAVVVLDKRAFTGKIFLDNKLAFVCK